MKHLYINTLAVLFLSSRLLAQEPSSDENQKEIRKISEAFGHLMGKNIESMGVNFDIQYVIEGLKNAAAGKDAPMTEVECIQAISAAQETAFKAQSTDNLAAAENFLTKNSAEIGIVALEDGKVQYKIEKEGSGDPLKENATPLVRYTGKFLNGEIFGSSTEDEPISLEEIIPGLKAGITGMKEGEKRTIYIHPDCAYGTKGALPPNSLLTFEIEVVKTDCPVMQEALTIPSHAEIAEPEGLVEHIR